MKIKNDIEFLTFNDGIVRIYETNDADELIIDSRRDYRFGTRKIGITRYYEARHNDIELNKLIHIHYCKDVTAAHAAVIGNTRYVIEQVQQEPYNNPPCTLLSLSQFGEWIDREEDG